MLTNEATCSTIQYLLPTPISWIICILMSLSEPHLGIDLVGLFQFSV